MSNEALVTTIALPSFETTWDEYLSISGLKPCIIEGSNIDEHRFSFDEEISIKSCQKSRDFMNNLCEHDEKEIDQLVPETSTKLFKKAYYTIDDLKDFKPRLQENMPFNQKVSQWINSLVVPKYVTTLVPGEGVQFSFVEPYPGTASQTFSDFQTEHGEEELNWRYTTMKVLEEYRSEYEKPKKCPGSSPVRKINIDISPSFVRGRGYFPNNLKAEGSNLSRRAHMGSRPRANTSSSSAENIRVMTRKNRSRGIIYPQRYHQQESTLYVSNRIHS